MDDSFLPQLRAGEGWVEFQLRVSPKAPCNQICGWVDGALKVKLKAPPVEGKANKALEEFLAQVLQVPKKEVWLISGKTSRIKRVRVLGLSPQALLQRLEGKK